MADPFFYGAAANYRYSGLYSRGGEAMFALGASYTRQQIHDGLGGSLQSYLPTVDGRVTCACLDPAKNPNAPSIILVGKGPRIISSAETLCHQGGSIPVKRATNEWVFEGEFLVKARTQSSTVIAEHARRSGRDDIHVIVELERAAPT